MSTQRYRTKEGDVIDAICWRFYGTTSGGQVEAVLEANRGLGLPALGPRLPAGLIIELPEITTNEGQSMASFFE